ncbi:hypothetical protein CIPAW_16G021900 [Carya illinoinensis]|uniref:Uncharacterized protein n=1 Tax=Carya illinoinensis TaxID=32201 RepID=A0A8T1N1J7_CARIL|nr:hypothetical protein CIPAW_16G021900 [Carya illinoinensis]
MKNQDAGKGVVTEEDQPEDRLKKLTPFKPKEESVKPKEGSVKPARRRLVPKEGSVIPARRRLVKAIMATQIVHFLQRLASSSAVPKCTRAPQTTSKTSRL